MGSLSSQCDLTTGQCSCTEDYRGRRCDQCPFGYYRFPRCVPCDCHVPGTQRDKCQVDVCECDDLGQCPCKVHFIVLPRATSQLLTTCVNSKKEVDRFVIARQVYSIGANLLYCPLSQQGLLDPIKLAYFYVVIKPAPSSQRLKQLREYATSPSHRAHRFLP